MHIRPALPNDFLAVSALDRKAWANLLHGNEVIPDGEHTWRMWCEHALMFVAEEATARCHPALDGERSRKRSESEIVAGSPTMRQDHSKTKEIPQQVRDDSMPLLGAILAFPTQTPALYCFHKIFVHPDARGTGAGKALMQALLSAAEEKSLRLFLTVAPDNASAKALYEKMGFTVEREVKGYYRADEDRLVMVFG